jgi:hypothetical protein
MAPRPASSVAAFPPVAGHCGSVHGSHRRPLSRSWHIDRGYDHVDLDRHACRIRPARGLLICAVIVSGLRKRSNHSAVLRVFVKLTPAANLRTRHFRLTCEVLVSNRSTSIRIRPTHGAKGMAPSAIDDLPGPETRRSSAFRAFQSPEVPRRHQLRIQP